MQNRGKVLILHKKHTMNHFDEEIIEAHTEWMEAQKNVPKFEGVKGYKYRNLKAKKLYSLFADMCYEHKLNPIQTSWDIIKNKR